MNSTHPVPITPPGLLLSAKPRRSRSFARADAVSMPSPSRALLRWFGWYSERYIARHFHQVSIARNGLPARLEGIPTVVYLNHASWWDPLVCLLLARRYFAGRDCFAPIDASALQRYAIFKRLGFFGVEPRTARGARQFLRASETILRDPNSMLWLTPEGEFVDARRRPIRFEPGLGHLAARLEQVAFVPLAIDYRFRGERLGEIAVQFGNPIIGEAGDSAEEWTELLTQKLTSTMDTLAGCVAQSDRENFTTLLGGERHMSGVYGWWLRIRDAFRSSPSSPPNS